MSRTYDFVIGAKGDKPAEIKPWCERVTITFHSDGNTDSEEEEYLKDVLSEWADGYCIKYEDFIEDQIKLEATHG